MLLPIGHVEEQLARLNDAFASQQFANFQSGQPGGDGAETGRALSRGGAWVEARVVLLYSGVIGLAPTAFQAGAARWIVDVDAQLTIRAVDRGVNPRNGAISSRLRRRRA